MTATDSPNVLRLLESQCARFQSEPLFWEKRDGTWQSLSWADYREQVRDFASALLARGFKRGSGVAILSGTRKEWPICDMGGIYAGGVCVGLYTTSSPEQIRYMVSHSES